MLTLPPLAELFAPSDPPSADTVIAPLPPPIARLPLGAFSCYRHVACATEWSHWYLKREFHC